MLTYLGQKYFSLGKCATWVPTFWAGFCPTLKSKKEHVFFDKVVRIHLCECSLALFRLKGARNKGNVDYVKNQNSLFSTSVLRTEEMLIMLIPHRPCERDSQTQNWASRREALRGLQTSGSMSRAPPLVFRPSDLYCQEKRDERREIKRKKKKKTKQKRRSENTIEE